jgi:hypothetical protein
VQTSTSKEITSAKPKIEYLEIKDKKLAVLDDSMKAIESADFVDYRISTKIDLTKLSPEQLQYVGAFDKVQASVYTMLCNANKRQIPTQFLVKSSVVMAKDFFDHL